MTLSNRSALLSLVLICLVVYLPGLTALPPFDQDEALFAQASRQMLETGDFVQIRFQEEARNRKPALSYWLQAASAWASGTPDAIWPYRVPSIAGLTLATLLTFWIGLRFFDGSTAFVGAALFATSINAVTQAHMARADAVLIPLVVAAQGALGAAYLHARERRPSPRQLWLVFWIAQGLAILAKGPILILTSALTILALGAIDRDWRWLASLRPMAGAGLAVAIAAPWFVATTLAGSGNFVGDAIATDLLPKLLGVDQQVPHLALLAFPIRILVTVVVGSHVGVGHRNLVLEGRGGDVDHLQAHLVVPESELALDILIRHRHPIRQCAPELFDHHAPAKAAFEVGLGHRGILGGKQLLVATFTDETPVFLEGDRKSTRLNSSHTDISRMPSSA